MLSTRICNLLGIRHPVVLGGMGTATNPELVAAVSNAGGLGILSVTFQSADHQRQEVQRIRELIDGPFGLNHLLFLATEERLAATVDSRPRVFSTAWAWPEQDLKDYAEMAKQAGALFM